MLSANRGEYGVTNVGKQALTLMGVSAMEEGVFEFGKELFEFTILIQYRDVVLL